MARSHAKTDELPLRSRTSDAWAVAALREPLALLSDHAHLEKKAAANAMEMLTRWPEPRLIGPWTQTLASVAKDETEHLVLVLRLLERKGGSLAREHRNPYANGLRKLVRLGTGRHELIDRLLVSALIEARSCERFEALGRNCDDADLARLYHGLWSSEHGHYRQFVELATLTHTARAVEVRWDALLDAEAALLAEQSPGPRMHSGERVA